MKKIFLYAFIIALTLPVLFIACTAPAPEGNREVSKKPRQRKAPATKGYHFVKPKEWIATNRPDFSDATKQHIILAVNRIDSAHFLQLDSALVPNDLSGDLEFYLPFPFKIAAIKDIEKNHFLFLPRTGFWRL